MSHHPVNPPSTTEHRSRVIQSLQRVNSLFPAELVWKSPELVSLGFSHCQSLLSVVFSLCSTWAELFWWSPHHFWCSAAVQHLSPVVGTQRHWNHPNCPNCPNCRPELDQQTWRVFDLLLVSRWWFQSDPEVKLDLGFFCGNNSGNMQTYEEAFQDSTQVYSIKLLKQKDLQRW